MGLNIATLKFISTCLKQEGTEITDKRICMYGNLHLKKGTGEIQTRLGTKLASAYFIDYGASEIIMLDVNKSDGALPVNLSKPIDSVDLLGSFDMLIDGGTSEHIRNQYNCFHNAFNLCKVDALMFHVLPVKNHWGSHGRWNYPMDFFVELACYSGYTTIDIHQNNYVSELVGGKHDLAFVCFKREVHSTFVSQEIFQEKLIPMLGKRAGK